MTSCGNTTKGDGNGVETSSDIAITTALMRPNETWMSCREREWALQRIDGLNS